MRLKSPFRLNCLQSLSQSQAKYYTDRNAIDINDEIEEWEEKNKSRSRISPEIYIDDKNKTCNTLLIR